MSTNIPLQLQLSNLAGFICVAAVMDGGDTIANGLISEFSTNTLNDEDRLHA